MQPLHVKQDVTVMCVHVCMRVCVCVWCVHVCVCVTCMCVCGACMCVCVLRVCVCVVCTCVCCVVCVCVCVVRNYSNIQFTCWKQPQHPTTLVSGGTKPYETCLSETTSHYTYINRPNLC